MKLTDRQLADYDQKGFIVLSGILTPAEVKLLQFDAEILRTPKRGHPDANVYEKDGTSLRAAWAVEIDSEACRIAHRIPRLLEPVRQLMGEDIYLYQSRLNYKEALRGDVFQWHQDYGSWVEDGVPSGGHHDMLSILITLDDTASENGPLRLIAGSHQEGLIRTDYDEKTTSYALHVVDDATVDRLLDGREPFECVGPAGTVVLFGSCVVHGSKQNRSPRDRRNLYFAYNRRSNIPAPGSVRRKHANNYIMNPDTLPLSLVPDDALVQLANNQGFTGSTSAAA